MPIPTRVNPTPQGSIQPPPTPGHTPMHQHQASQLPEAKPHNSHRASSNTYQLSIHTNMKVLVDPPNPPTQLGLINPPQETQKQSSHSSLDMPTQNRGSTRHRSQNLTPVTTTGAEHHHPTNHHLLTNGFPAPRSTNHMTHMPHYSKPRTTPRNPSYTHALETIQPNKKDD